MKREYKRRSFRSILVLWSLFAIIFSTPTDLKSLHTEYSKMTSQIGLLILAVVGIFLVQSSSGQISSEVLERINVDTYLQNRRLVEYHINCLVYNGPCDKIGNEIKRLYNSFKMSGVSASECRVCNEEQKQRLSKIARHWQANYPAAWRDLTRIMN